MDKDARVLSNLIENLEDVKGKLSSLDYGREWINCILPKKESRSYINMKTVLESLVMKTVEGKGYDEDIASICNQHKPFLEKHLQFQNLFSSEEYLMEATNLPKMPLKFEFLHSSLSTFQDFLGDILHSVCQISSCHLKLPSKILVKDLLKLKNQYLSIWDLISSVFGENNCRRDSDCSLMVESKGIKSRVSEIQKCLQMSLKEMSKVKLEIEHYFKCNLIEINFTKCPSDGDSRESVSSKEEVLESNAGSEYSLLKRITSSSQGKTPNNMNACSFPTKKQQAKGCPTKPFQQSNGGLSSPSLISTEAQSHRAKGKGTTNNSHNCPPETKTWNEISNSFIETPCRDFFQQPKNFILPPNFLFLDPSTILIQSKKDVQKINSLPKIYSVDSFNENIIKEPTLCTSLSCQKDNKIDRKIYHNATVEKVEEMQPTKSLTEEDLFSESKNKENQTDSCSICLQEKMSSLFDMLRSSETIYGDEDIFEENPLKIERSDFSYSQTLQNCNNTKLDTNRENIPSNVSSLGKPDYTNKNHPDSNTYKNKLPSGRKNKENCISKGNFNYEIPLHFGGLKGDYNKEKSIAQTEDVIYDKRSLIELYHTKEVNQGLNTGSTPGELSSFSLWPVTAEYIQVSKSKRPHKCESMSSDNSIPLSKSIGKSFYSPHLNKIYEQKQHYDGDLIVLGNTERTVQKESSSSSLLNQSYSVFNQEENYKAYEKVNNGQNGLGKQIKLCQKNNLSNFKKGRDLNSKGKKCMDVKKTLAVHYKDCGEPFKVTDKNFNRENFDFLKVNGFDNNNNWNSFISIFTSKVVPTTQINHHRMFRKVINTFTSDSLTCNNFFGNVHTLTSNGGPFRLFDINGYPLTDSAGNVLKDPYGKSVVTLDSTGFPKDDINVFDAAGNSPNDINFDPTQKPKTNSIIIKLTDNFKRPLHLFDKYGRPLTDSCGKLLVNIHGRPLLRFDNFGRPNTDYRGGPLYTDNGYRWSYKTGDSLSTNQLSNDSLIPKKLCGFLENESRLNSYENLSLQDKSGDRKNISTFEKVETKPTDKQKPVLDPSQSDIWSKVENVLQKFPKKNKIDPKTSQTSVIVNNVTIAQNPIEKEFLKSIIYHNSIVQADEKNLNGFHSQCSPNYKTYHGFQNINSCQVDKRLTEANRTIYMSKVLATDRYKPYFTAPQYQNSFFAKSPCSKCVSFDYPKHIPSNKLFNEQSFNLGKAFTCDAGDLLKNPMDVTLTTYPKNGITNKHSYITLQNRDYLNNLCNKILKHEINYSGKTKDPTNHVNTSEVFIKSNNWTDTSNTEFLSSIGSKYTTGLTTQTESPVYFSDTSKNQSQDLKTSNKYYNSYLEQQQPLHVYERDLDCFNKDKYCGDYYHIKSKKDTECTRQKSRCIISEQTKDQFQNESGMSLAKLKDDTMSVTILNKDDKHYEIKVTEMLSKIINPKLSFGLFSKGKNNIEKPFSLHTSPKRKTETSSNNEHNTENSRNKITNKKHNITENYKEKVNNSLFRFSSDETTESTSTSERNIKASYSKKAIYLSDLNVCKDGCKVQREETKHLTDQTNNTFTQDKGFKNNQERHSIKPITQSEQSEEPPQHKKEQVHKINNINKKSTYAVKKPVSSNRECNLASFLGSPVKYVLNKLDGKRSVKPNKTNPSVKKKTFSNSKENVKRLCDGTRSKNKVKPINDITTLYDINKSSKNNLLSSSEKAEKNQKDKLFPNEQDRLLAFPSKSCTGLVCQDKDVLMCYSGDSQSVNRKKLSQGFSSSSTKLQKSISATSYITVEKSRDKDYIRRRSTKYEQGKEIPKSRRSTMKPNMTRRKYSKNDYSTQKSSKSPKGSSGRHSKSPLFSSRTKAKEISLFKKVEPEGKYMLKIKR